MCDSRWERCPQKSTCWDHFLLQNMKNQTTLIIAEAGVNHNGNIETAKRLIDVAAEAEADMIKFQTFSADRLVTTSARKAEYQNKATDASESQTRHVKQAGTFP